MVKNGTLFFWPQQMLSCAVKSNQKSFPPPSILLGDTKLRRREGRKNEKGLGFCGRCYGITNAWKLSNRSVPLFSRSRSEANWRRLGWKKAKKKLFLLWSEKHFSLFLGGPFFWERFFLRVWALMRSWIWSSFWSDGKAPFPIFPEREEKE